MMVFLVSGQQPNGISNMTSCREQGYLAETPQIVKYVAGRQSSIEPQNCRGELPPLANAAGGTTMQTSTMYITFWTPGT